MRQTDSDLWAESYDRKLSDIFGVESEIAKRVAESLQAKLSGREEQALAVKPTNNPEAYDAYLRGLAFEARNFDFSPGFGPSLVAAGFLERAVQLDRNFAIAWARLSRVDAHVYFDRVDTTSAARGDAAKRALENAQKLEPNSPETLLSLGYYQYWVLRDYGSARTTFERISKLLPGTSEVPYALGRIARRQGRWDESNAAFEQALASDPRNIELLAAAAWNYTMLRQFPTALKFYDRELDIIPNDPAITAGKVGIYQAQGNVQEAAKFLSEINGQTLSEQAFHIKITQLRVERDYGEAIRLLQARLNEFHFDSEFMKAGDQLDLALIERFAGDVAGAKNTAEQARNTLEPLYKHPQDNPRFAVLLSVSYALCGDRNSALKEAERAIMDLPSTKDAVDGPGVEENLALIQTIAGDESRAISTLNQVLQKPGNSWFYPEVITPALLRLDPVWDPLRSDPRFEKLVEEAKKPVAMK